jgi:hypothetical protein
MKAYLPYVYSFQFIPPKRVRPVYADGAGTVELDVPEISLSETGLAASLEYVLEQPQQTVVMPTEFRTWNGSLLTRVSDETLPVFKTSWLPSAPDGRSRTLYAKPLYGFAMFEGQKVEECLSGYERSVIHREPPKGKVVRSNEDREYTIVKRLGDDLVSVEGELWRKTRYAALCLDMRSSIRENAPLHAFFTQEPYGYLPFARNTVERRRLMQPRKLFDVAQAERLVHHAGQLGAERNFRSLVIHNAAALAFDGEREFLKDSMDFTVLTTESTLGELSASAVAAWDTMRSAVERVSAAADDVFTDGEIEAFRHLAAEYKGENAHLVAESMAWCDDYLNDDWGRYGSHGGRTPDLPKAGM